MSNMSHKQTPIRKQSSYLPTLDGWRAIAIISVILCHESVLNFGPFSTKWLHDYGDRGVDVFFSISGILICSRLLDEERKNGFISLRSFYLRRIFRILPAALVYLFIVLILGFAGYLIVQKTEIFAAMFFYRNYTRLLGRINISDAVFTGHFWSLSIEEHFYLLLPGLLLLTKRRFRIPAMVILIFLVIANRANQLQLRPWST